MLFLGGVLISFYMIYLTFIAPKFVLRNAVFMTLLGQIISAAIIDHYGLLDSIQNPLLYKNSWSGIDGFSCLVNSVEPLPAKDQETGSFKLIG